MIQYLRNFRLLSGMNKGSDIYDRTIDNLTLKNLPGYNEFRKKSLWKIPNSCYYEKVRTLCSLKT